MYIPAKYFHPKTPTSKLKSHNSSSMPSQIFPFSCINEASAKIKDKADRMAALVKKMDISQALKYW